MLLQCSAYLKNCRVKLKNNIVESGTVYKTMKNFLKQILTFYYYIFYCIYRFWTFVNTTEWGAATRSVIAILALEIWTFFSILEYLNLSYSFFDMANKNEYLYYFSLVPILLLNLFLFSYKDKWKLYFEKFRKYDKIKRLKLDIISWVIIIGLLVNFVYSVSFYNK